MRHRGWHKSPTLHGRSRTDSRGHAARRRGAWRRRRRHRLAATIIADPGAQAHQIRLQLGHRSLGVAAEYIDNSMAMRVGNSRLLSGLSLSDNPGARSPPPPPLARPQPPVQDVHGTAAEVQAPTYFGTFTRALAGCPISAGVLQFHVHHAPSTWSFAQPVAAPPAPPTDAAADAARVLADGRVLTAPGVQLPPPRARSRRRRRSSDARSSGAGGFFCTCRVFFSCTNGRPINSRL